jgi:hypothetical protein
VDVASNRPPLVFRAHVCSTSCLPGIILSMQIMELFAHYSNYPTYKLSPPQVKAREVVYCQFPQNLTHTHTHVYTSTYDFKVYFSSKSRADDKMTIPPQQISREILINFTKF